MRRADPLAPVERAAVAEEVASVMRHDVRNKLATIRNATFYVMRRVKGTETWASDPRLSQFFELIEREIGEATELLEGPSATVAHREPRLVEAMEAVDLAIAAAHLREGIDLRVDVDAGTLRADPAELALALRVLLDNAGEAIGAEVGRVTLTGRARDGVYAIQVVDDGPGFSPEAREDAMRPFFTTKVGHAGLGLAIARRIARRYGGRCEIGPGPAEVVLEVPLGATEAT
jgi:signal transduction histidine kinase